uniref:BHLH domain-containing protein n=1 Tax=Plectus sambesii TaxID=2011161 RepID=A0A914UHK9_9BILA
MRGRNEMSSWATSTQQSERERLRQVYVNRAFANLRKILPSYPINKKMSKHEILRGAIHYIAFLERVRASQDRRALLQDNQAAVDDHVNANV